MLLSEVGSRFFVFICLCQCVPVIGTTWARAGFGCNNFDLDVPPLSGPMYGSRVFLWKHPSVKSILSPAWHYVSSTTLPHDHLWLGGSVFCRGSCHFVFYSFMFHHGGGVAFILREGGYSGRALFEFGKLFQHRLAFFFSIHPSQIAPSCFVHKRRWAAKVTGLYLCIEMG